MIYCTPIHYTGTKKIALHIILSKSKTEIITKRREKFKDKLKIYLPAYGKDMLNSFYKYWIELNKSQTKMRFEMEKTWELELRLIRWAKSNKSEKYKSDNNFHISAPIQVDHR